MPEVDVVYNALPTALHAHWTHARAARGQARALREALRLERPGGGGDGGRGGAQRAPPRRGLPLALPPARRAHPRRSARGGALGRIERLAASFSAPIRDRSDIRWNLALGGGASMDLGCYPVHWCRSVMGAEPEVIAAQAREGPPRVDVSMRAELRFPGARRRRAGDGARHLLDGRRRALRGQPRGDGERRRAPRPEPSRAAARAPPRAAPRRRAARRRRFRAAAPTITSSRRWCARLRSGAPLPTGGADAMANLRVLDGIYRAAGLGPRGE